MVEPRKTAGLLAYHENKLMKEKNYTKIQWKNNFQKSLQNHGLPAHYQKFHKNKFSNQKNIQ